MYGLPSDVNLHFFDGKVLLQACFGGHDLILNFDGSVSITVTSAIGCESPDGLLQRYDDFPLSAPQVVRLLNQTVASATGVEGRTLSLQFADGSKLYVYDDSREYESYTIRNGDQVIVV